jgi:hypothetical protein
MNSGGKSYFAHILGQWHLRRWSIRSSNVAKFHELVLDGTLRRGWIDQSRGREAFACPVLRGYPCLPCNPLHRIVRINVFRGHRPVCVPDRNLDRLHEIKALYVNDLAIGADKCEQAQRGCSIRRSTLLVELRQYGSYRAIFRDFVHSASCGSFTDEIVQHTYKNAIVALPSIFIFYPLVLPKCYSFANSDAECS